MSSRAGHEVNGTRIAKARVSRGMTQARLADEAGIHRVTLTRIENGDAKVSLELLERLCRILGCTREHILGVPEHIDPVDAARERLATAVLNISDGLTDLADLVDALNERVRDETVEKAAA